jgi:hypothetical protein
MPPESRQTRAAELQTAWMSSRGAQNATSPAGGTLGGRISTYLPASWGNLRQVQLRTWPHDTSLSLALGKQSVSTGVSRGLGSVAVRGQLTTEVGSTAKSVTAADRLAETVWEEGLPT